MKVLIVGASGYLGKVLFNKCGGLAGVSVCGTYLTKQAESMVFLDVLDKENTVRTVESYAPDVIVWCLKNPDKELEITSKGLRTILSAAKPDTRFLYISTGLSPEENQNEETPSQPRSEGMYLADYVNGKILGEELVRKHVNHVVIRPGQIYGFGVKGEMDERMRRVKDAVEKHGEMIRAANAYISVVHVEDLADCIIEMFYHAFTGTLCVASEKPVSYCEFYRYLAGQIGIDEDKIVAEYAEKPSGSYFNTAKAKALLTTKIRKLYEAV